MRLLLVENGGFSRRVIGGIFNRIDVHVDYVASEEEAMRSSHYNYDLVLISDSLDYVNIVNYIRHAEKGSNFIVLMCHEHKQDSQYVRGIDVVSNKPLNEREAKLLIEAKDKYGKVFYGKANVSTFKQMRSAHSTNDSSGRFSTRQGLPLR